jgi:hypothetical protein
MFRQLSHTIFSDGRIGIPPEFGLVFDFSFSRINAPVIFDSTSLILRLPSCKLIVLTVPMEAKYDPPKPCQNQSPQERS